MAEHQKNKVPTRAEFVRKVGELAGEVYDFHTRWGEKAVLPDKFAETAISRLPLLKEEVEELEEAAFSSSPSHICEEAADVLFVSIGNLNRFAEEGLAAMETVRRKNALKTELTHVVTGVSGKIVKK